MKNIEAMADLAEDMSEEIAQIQGNGLGPLRAILAQDHTDGAEIDAEDVRAAAMEVYGYYITDDPYDHVSYLADHFGTYPEHILEALEEESDESLRHQYPDLVDYAGNPMREVIAAEMAAEDLRMQSVALVDPIDGKTHWFHIA